MDKDTVTRTFSIGAIGSRTVASDDSPTGRRHSSAGIRALLWATSGAKSFGCSLGSDSQTSRENIFPNILTPDSIPQFTIPSLSLQSGSRSLNKAEDAESEEGSGSSASELESSVSVHSGLSSAASSSSLSSFLLERKAERSISDPFMQRKYALQREGSYPCSEAQHSLDPTSRAALSLPHLSKVTTPYGFITLSQSPQMANEEALLCQAGVRRSPKNEEMACCLGKAAETRKLDPRGDDSHACGDKKTFIKNSTDSQTQGRSLKFGRKTSSASFADTVASAASAASASKHRDVKLKHRFYEVIKKHFTSH